MPDSPSIPHDSGPDPLPDSPWSLRRPRIRLRTALILLAAHILAGLWLGAMAVLTSRMEGHPLAWTQACTRELTGALAVYALLPIPLAVIVNAPGPSVGWGRFLGLHALGAAAFVITVPTLFMAVRTVIWPLAGWGRFACSPPRLQIPFEVQRMAFVYAILLGVFHFTNHLATRRSQALLQARLKSQLQEAKLRNLSAQLDPHFLFNALNTISSVMYENPEESDRLFSALGQMLRDGLEEGGPTWPLHRELDHLASFLDLVGTRFGKRLKVVLEVDEGLGPQPVPRFAIQRLVENAVKHNQDRLQEGLAVDVRVAREAKAIRVTVSDNGQGFGDPREAATERGVGLGNLASALALIHGADGQLETRNRPGGGALVTFRVPMEKPHA